MGILADHQIRDGNFILPFSEGGKRPGKVSYGVTSYGYDARIGYKFKVFTNAFGGEIDPKNFNDKHYIDVDLTPPGHHWSSVLENERGMVWQCQYCNRKTIAVDPNVYEPCPNITSQNYILVPPNSLVLGETIEHFDIPRDVLAVVVGKSTYARCGLIVNVTPGEPEWKGKWTVEISNTTTLPARVYCGEGIMQVLFFRADGVPCEISYADKKGKYQDQAGLTLPTVDKTP